MLVHQRVNIGWWFGTWILFSHWYMGCHPSQVTYIFWLMVKTTNQINMALHRKVFYKCWIFHCHDYQKPYIGSFRSRSLSAKDRLRSIFLWASLNKAGSKQTLDASTPLSDWGCLQTWPCASLHAEAVRDFRTYNETPTDKRETISRPGLFSWKHSLAAARTMTSHRA